MKKPLNAVLVTLIALFITSLSGMASAGEVTIFDSYPAVDRSRGVSLHTFGPSGKVGVTNLGIYFESSLFRDRGLGWSGSETTFQIQAKLDITHTLYEDVMFRFKGSYRPTVNDYTIGINEIKEREANFEDTYAKFSNLFGYQSELRLGIVKVPFGLFDTMAFQNKNRPVSFFRTREWDYGLRYDAWHGKMGYSFAIINGDGREGTDANSAKSVALRIIYSKIKGDRIYPETYEVTRYPNPVNANPGRDFVWRFGISGYAGNKYSTPIKIKNNHYGADLEVAFSIFNFKTQYSYLEGGFTKPEDGSVADLSGYSSKVTNDIDTFARGWSSISELSVGVSKKTLVTFMSETYDPDSQSNDEDNQKTKTRLVLGVKHDFRPGVTAAMFYTLSNDPAFDDVRNSKRGDDILQVGVALQF